MTILSTCVIAGIALFSGFVTTQVDDIGTSQISPRFLRRPNRRLAFRRQSRYGTSCRVICSFVSSGFLGGIVSSTFQFDIRSRSNHGYFSLPCGVLYFVTSLVSEFFSFIGFIAAIGEINRIIRRRRFCECCSCTALILQSLAGSTSG